MPALHPHVHLDALTPRYVTRFACAGARCEDNCCTGWRVTVDHKTFVTYKASAHSALRDRFAGSVNRVRSNATPGAYATIGQDDTTGECVFLEDRLCAIQRELGVDKLSNTCSEYPRSQRHTCDGVEQALTLSCPEAARQALLNADAMDFVVHRAAFRKDALSKVVRRQGWEEAQLRDVRDFCVQVMLSDGLALWQRLAVLGLFCERLDAAERQRRAISAPALIDEFTQMVTSGAAAAALEDVQPFHDAQARLFFDLWLSRRSRRLSPHQREVHRAVLDGLGLQPDDEGHAATPSATDLTERYSRGVRRLEAALEATPGLIRNYVVNEMFREFFPFATQPTFVHFQRLLLRFGMVRFLLAARCNTPDGTLPRPEELAATVQVFCRRFQHDAQFASRLDEALTLSGWDRLEKLFRFLRS
jgi:lysine-N-methylase